VYPVDGDLTLDGFAVPERTFAVLAAGASVSIESRQPVRLMVLGGAPLDGHRHMWWNFVSSRKERIVQAAADWEAMRPDAGMGQVAGETEFIPLPGRRFTA
jgi:redox-sensitive bicupin YhaK (pirin superfamily)